MSSDPSGPIFECFQSLEDPRTEYLVDHKLIDIIVLTICAVICGADHWTEVEVYGQAKEEWLRTFLELPYGIPSHDTIGTLFSRLDADQFRACFLEWVEAVNGLVKGQVVALDGKTLRRSHNRKIGKQAIHMVSAWAASSNLVLGQIKTDEKSNEITAIPALLDMLSLSGCIVTIDAMGCQRDIAQKILDRDADYILAVKENQPSLYRKTREMFEDTEASDIPYTQLKRYSRTEKDHGRIETRICSVIDDPDYLFYLQGPKEDPPWAGLASIIKIESIRQVGQTVSTETRYYISSLKADAKTLNNAIRQHWRVENSLHWVLDVAFREDDCRVRKGQAPEIFAVLRHMALNLLKQERSAKVGIQGKRLRAAWDTRYLLRVLGI